MKWKVAIGLVLLLGLGGTYFAWRLGVFELMDDVRSSSSRLDEVHRRAQEAGMPSTVAEMFPGEVDEDSNAEAQMRALVQELIRIDKQTTAWMKSDPGSGKSSLQFAEKALELAHAASRKSVWRPKRVWDRAAWLTFPEYRYLRDAVKLLSARAAHRARSGDRKGALADLGAALRLAERIGDEPILISQLVRIACRNIATVQIVRIASVHPREREFLAQLASLIQDEVQPGIRKALMGEVFTSYALARNLPALGGIKGLETFTALDGDGAQTRPPLEDSRIVKEGLPGPMIERAQLTRILELYLHLWGIAQSDDPLVFSSAAKAIETQLESRAVKSRPSYIMARILIPVLSTYGLSVTNVEAQRRTSYALLRALEHRARYGAWPKDPTFGMGDPFLPGRPLRFKASPQGLKIWSVGRNLVDEDGLPLSRPGPLEPPGAIPKGDTVAEFPYQVRQR